MLWETKRTLRIYQQYGWKSSHWRTFQLTWRGHSLSDMTITILEKVKSNDDLYRKEREKKFHSKIQQILQSTQQTTLN